MSAGPFDARDTALVIGLGRSGMATSRVLRARGATVYVTGEDAAAALAPALEDLAAIGARFIAPADLGGVLAKLTMAVLSPGVPLTNPIVRRVQEAHVGVYSEIEIAYRICKAPIVAITGTKGKTTTTALVGAMFRRAGVTTHVGGNIGNALIEETARAAAGDVVVAEVSSFQLESIRSFKPLISTILNISPDHLDRYHSMDEYSEAKFRIFANQGAGDTFVGNADDPYVGALAAGDGRRRINARALWFARERGHDATLYLRDERIVYAPPSGDPRPQEIMPLSEISLRGSHNVANVMAALLVGLAADLDPTALRDAVRAFRALPHRLEPVEEIDGVTYVDDSKSTNPGSAIAALESFAQPVVLVAGGRSKGTDFAAMRDAVAKHAKATIVIGEAAGEIARALNGLTVRQAASMDDAVALARSLADRGDIVLLSPGCASFDMFASAEARGDAFAAAVRSLLAGAHGR